MYAELSSRIHFQSGSLASGIAFQNKLSTYGSHVIPPVGELIVCHIRSLMVYRKLEDQLMKQQSKRLVFLLTIASFVLAACSPASETATPTEVNIDAIYTAAAATVFAGQTSTALAQPPSTLTATPTTTQTATITTTPTATKPVYIPPVLPVITITKTQTGTPPTPTPSATATFGAVGCNNSAFLLDVTIPNNTKMTAGQAFRKTWRIKNTGTCDWVSAYKFTFIGGNVMGSDTTKIRRTVGVGGTTDFSLDMVAPSSPGTYSGYWRMADDTGKLFGAGFNVVIVVPGATFTPTTAASVTMTSPAPAATATQTQTQPPTATQTIAPPPAPTDTETAAPTP